MAKKHEPVGTSSEAKRSPSVFAPTWTSSYRLYGQPHAVWLDRFTQPGVNLPLLERTLKAAEAVRQVPEFVIYAIPLRDLGQSSEGGFSDYRGYQVDNRLNASKIQIFVQKTGLHPVVYLEPDSLPLAVQYRRDRQDDAISRKIYEERIQATRMLIALYRNAGARVYLEAGHGGWFDYADADVRRIADALNEAGIREADGLATNISNRQPVFAETGDIRTEWRYLGRLLPLLQNPRPDVRVDTGRNGGPTHARQYYLAPDGRLWDNERPEGRLVGHWMLGQSEQVVGALTSTSPVRFKPFFGPEKTLARLLSREKYAFDAGRRILSAPPWLDAVGDVRLGPPPTDQPPFPVSERIGHYRYIKPPDDSDGALNYPAGESKNRINVETKRHQPSDLRTRSISWL